METKLKYFRLAKELNHECHDDLQCKKAHFRGNINGMSLISLDERTPERGESGIKEKDEAKSKLDAFDPKEPGRSTPEKALQAWIILHAIHHDNLLPFGDNLTFITSELAIDRTVNDILAIDEQGALVVIELKSERVNKVKEQALEFRAIIDRHKEFFAELTGLMTGRRWNGEVRCVVVWPKPEPDGNTRPIDPKYAHVEEYVYSGSYTITKA